MRALGLGPELGTVQPGVLTVSVGANWWLSVAPRQRIPRVKVTIGGRRCGEMTFGALRPYLAITDAWQSIGGTCWEVLNTLCGTGGSNSRFPSKCGC